MEQYDKPAASAAQNNVYHGKSRYFPADTFSVSEGDAENELTLAASVGIAGPRTVTGNFSAVSAALAIPRTSQNLPGTAGKVGDTVK